MKNLLNIQYVNIIITEIKNSRKGAAMTIILICLCCAAIDYIFRKHGITEDWFTQTYLIIGFLSTCIFAAKTYNSIADKADKRKKFFKKYNEITPLFSLMSDEEEYILKKFVQDNAYITFFEDEYLSKINHNLNVINTIYSRFKCFNYNIVQTSSNPVLSFRIDKEFLELLKEYFKNKD